MELWPGDHAARDGRVHVRGEAARHRSDRSGDAAAEAIKDAEAALEKATASRGLLAVQYNEPDLYGYTDENADALEAFLAGRDGMLPWSYGLEITRLVMAAYMSAEKKRVVDLTDPATRRELDTYVPLIQQGRGAGQLYPA